MADQRSLRAIGFGLSAITALVIVAAAFVVADAQRADPEFAVAASTAR